MATKNMELRIHLSEEWFEKNTSFKTLVEDDSKMAGLNLLILELARRRFEQSPIIEINADTATSSRERLLKNSIIHCLVASMDMEAEEAQKEQENINTTQNSVGTQSSYFKGEGPTQDGYTVHF